MLLNETTYTNSVDKLFVRVYFLFVLKSIFKIIISCIKHVNSMLNMVQQREIIQHGATRE